MIFEKYDIRSPLDKHVETIFYFKDIVAKDRIERVVPTGNIFILFELDNIPRNTFDNDLKPNGTFRKVWVSGMHQKYLNISAHKHSEMLGVQLKPMGAYPFFRGPVNEINDAVRSAEIYFGEEILRIRDEIMQEQNFVNKFIIVEKWLLQLSDKSKSAPKEILEVLTNMANQPFSNHNDLLKVYPRTQKHLIDQFKKYSGLTPKALHRIFRFNKLLENINQKKEINWADIVFETGYADQSHFIKDFQNFCGFNPSKYIKNGYNNSDPNFFPVDTAG